MMIKSLLASCLAIASIASAQSFTYPTFAGASGLSLLANAQIDATSGNLLVTPNLLSQTGRVYTTTPVLVYAGFDTTFQFKVTRNGTGADGMSFIIHNSTSGGLVSPPSGTGSDNGYAGIDNALVVELDMYGMTTAPYSDTSSNEVSIHTMGTAPANAYESSSIGRASPATPLMNDQSVHTLRVTYSPGTLTVYLDDLVNPLLTTPYDFINGGTYVNSATPAPGLNLPNGDAWVGFTAATGGLSQSHEVLNWTWTSAAAPATCFSGTVGMGTMGTPQQILKVNGSSGGLLHTVNTTTFSNITISMSAWPLGGASPFVIWGFLGPATASTPFPTPYGDLCFIPQLVDPFNAFNLTLTDNIGLGLPGLIPSTPGAWSFTFPGGLPVPATVTFQGAIIDLGIPAITNSVTININQAPAPTVTNAVPAIGAPGTSVTITGTNFLPGATVTFGGIPASITTATATQIVAVVPAGVGCPGTIMVTNPDLQSASRNFNAQPNITGTLFGSGSVNGNATFYLLGNGFVAGTTVTIGGASAQILTTTATQVICRTPPGSVGVAPVVLTTPQGCTANTTYTYF